MSLIDSSNRDGVSKDMMGTIVSPNYPDNYGNNLRKEYKITAPQNSEIKLIFDDFDVQYGGTNCNTDSLTVRTKGELAHQTGPG